jgi:hypothetical protein
MSIRNCKMPIVLRDKDFTDDTKEDENANSDILT